MNEEEKKIAEDLPGTTEGGACSVAQALQARIDELMLEYCPGEMTTDQLREYERGQRPSVAYLLPFGYAPGEHTARCVDCNMPSYNLDKRATRCFKCADTAFNESFTEGGGAKCRT